MVKLRDYQERAIELVNDSSRAGKRAPLVVAPTGCGKTVIASAMMERAVARGHRCLFLAPRRELIYQTSRKLDEFGLPHGLVLAGCDARQDLYAPVQVASIDTLLARVVRKRRIELPEPHVVFVDEAHLAITAKRRELLDLFPKAWRVGLTATPTRKDGRALGALFDTIVEPTSITALIRAGWLVPARYFAPSTPDLSGVHVLAGDYNSKELATVMNQPRLHGDVVNHWLKHASDRRTVVFATSIEHSVALCEEFLRNGVAAEHVDANTPQHLRDATFERFRSGQTRVLCNCFLASYGFDLPELSCVVLARPTRSLMLYLQMIGRGLRPADGKKDCLVLDHSGAVHRHGFADDERVWTLEGDQALVDTRMAGADKRELKMLTCPECAFVFSGARLCPECGYFFAPKGREVRTLDGELVEIGQHLPRNEQDELVFYSELLGFAQESRYKQGWAYHKFRAKFDHYPPASFRHARPVQPSASTRGWIKSDRIRWLKARQQSSEATRVAAREVQP